MSEAKETGKVLAALWVAAGLLVFGAGAGWFWTAERTKAAVRAAVASAGAGSALGDLGVTGFPFRLTHEAANVALPAPGGWRIGAARVVATTLPLETHHWVMEEIEGLTLTGPGGAQWRIDLDRPQASVSWTGRGLRRLSVIAQGARLEGPEPGPGVEIGALSLQAVEDPARPADLAISIEASDIKGGPADAIVLRGLLPGGQSLAKQGWSRWAAGGGAFDVRYGRITRAGRVADDLTGRIDGAAPWRLTGKAATVAFEGGVLVFEAAPSR
jgi:hypothetical protein